MSSLPTLPKGESYFRTLFEACGEAFIVTNEQGQAVDCNEATLDLFACARSDILGTTPLDWSPELQPDGRRSDEWAAEIFSRAAAGETVCFEWENYRLDRKPVFVSVTVRRAVIDTQVCYLVVSRNDSDRKQAEEALRQERLLRDTIQDAIPGIAYALDANGFFRFWSHSLEGVTGRNADELKRINALDLFEGDDRIYISKRIEAVFANGQSDAQAELVAKDGHRTPFYFTGKRIEFNGDSILVGAGMDITARVQAERALREEQDRFRTLFESSPDPVWIVENNTFTECNEAAARILGYPNRSQLLFVHPSKLSPEIQPDGESSFAKAERMMALARKNGINRFEWIHTRANGENFPAEVTLSSITLQGRPAIYTVWRDITERQQAQEALKASETHFRTLFEQAAVGVAEIDSLSGRFLAINRKYCDIVGYSEDEMLQLDFPSITYPDDLADDLAHMEQLKSGQIRSFNIEKRYIHKDGHLVWVDLTVSPMWAPGSPPDKNIAIVQDITRRKEVEYQLELLARTDDLTGLVNRRHFLAQAELELSRSIRYGRQMSILMVDADFFKNINDLYGHAAGDSTLRQLANIFRGTLRSADLAGRFGGEEFAILLPETDHEMATELAERLRRDVAASKVPLKTGPPLQFTISIGVSSLLSKDDNLDMLISLADNGLYMAKNAGRNRVCSSLVPFVVT